MRACVCVHKSSESHRWRGRGGGTQRYTHIQTDKHTHTYTVSLCRFLFFKHLSQKHTHMFHKLRNCRRQVKALWCPLYIYSIYMTHMYSIYIFGIFSQISYICASFSVCVCIQAYLWQNIFLLNRVRQIIEYIFNNRYSWDSTYMNKIEKFDMTRGAGFWL